MSANPITLSLEQLDELHTLQCCLSAIADLMIPCDDLHMVNRDELSCLLDYLTTRHVAVLKGVG
ncbi:MAG: hypothetical protein Q8N96_00815 [Methylovulum sp.]|nr:hypothetical protein [Methylovulum sp.]